MSNRHSEDLRIALNRVVLSAQEAENARGAGNILLVQNCLTAIEIYARIARDCAERCKNEGP